METVEEVRKIEDRPVPPRFPMWAAIGSWAAVAIVVFAHRLVETNLYATLIALAAISYAVGKAIGAYNTALKQFHIDDLRWRVSNVEGWVQLRESALRQGQPWYDNEDSTTWEAEHRSSLSAAREQLAALRQQLREALEGRGQKDIAI